MKPSPASTQAILDHYNRYDETSRLKSDIGPFEQARTQELIARYLHPPPAMILDVGGAHGPYAFWLAGLGYAVHLVDLVPRYIEAACQASRRPGAPRLASLQVGDARQLEFEPEMADAVLLHGPLYLLVENSQNKKLWKKSPGPPKSRRPSLRGSIRTMPWARWMRPSWKTWASACFTAAAASGW